MNLQERIDLLGELGKYMISKDEQWELAKKEASEKNGWFIPTFIELSISNIVTQFLQKNILTNWAINLPSLQPSPKTVGIVMAGNIPLVGFHDFLSCFITGHSIKIKPSSKDEVLIKHLVQWIINQKTSLQENIQFHEMLKNCDAYIATGGNNTSHYFDYYFGKHPHVFRSHKTSVAILTGNESENELEKLADDVHLYFGLGCRNVTKIYVPKNYDFLPLLSAFKKYHYFIDHHKYKNNYDYNLAIQILNNKYYMTNGSLLLVENVANYSPIAQLHFEYYTALQEANEKCKTDKELQCIVGKNFTPFGEAQCPTINQYADGVDVLHFLNSL